jgi:hypothetical protein
MNQAIEAPTVYREACWKCGGDGYWHGRGDCRGDKKCTACDGVGFKVFKNSAADRAAAREKAAARKQERAVADAALNWARFHVEHPAIAAWMVESAATGFDFAISLRAAVEKWGNLSERQALAAENCMKRAAERKILLQNAAAAAESSAASVDVARLEAAFAKAKASGLKWPKIVLNGIRISPAGERSRNPGALYVVDRAMDLYLGKVQDGKFYASRDCREDQRIEVVSLMADPMGHAEAFGKLTGNCCICSRELTDPMSVARGIGPVCAERFGW